MPRVHSGEKPAASSQTPRRAASAAGSPSKKNQLESQSPAALPVAGQFQPPQQKEETMRDDARRDLDIVREIGMPDHFTPYTLYVTCVLSLSWALTAIPAMLPAFVAPPASGGAVSSSSNSTAPSFFTVIEEFGLDSHSAEYTTIVYFLGSLILGQMPCAYSDRIGRMPIVFHSALWTGVSTLVSAFAPNYPVFLLGRFFQGVFFTAATNVNWVMVCECVPLSCHGRASIVFGLMWVAGYCIIAPLAVWFPAWRTIFLVTGAATVVYAIIARLTLRESLAFLVHQKRRKEALEWIAQAEKFGGTKFSSASLDRLLMDDGSIHSDETFCSSDDQAMCKNEVKLSPDDESDSILVLMKKAMMDRKITKWMLISVYMWITDFLVYNGLSMTSTGIKVGDPYLNYALSGFVELPATFILPVLMDTIGRRPTVILSHIETSLALVAMCFISIESETLYLIVWLLAKFGTASSFIALYIYGSEIFPIQYRNICLGICCTLGNLGAIAAPYAAHLGLTNPWLVFAVYAAVSAVSAVLDFGLPETLHRPSSPTLLEGKQSPPVGRRRRHNQQQQCANP